MQWLTRVRPVAAKLIFPLLAAVLPVILIASSIRTLRELDSQRGVYLRSRAAAVLALLEALPPDVAGEDLFELIAAEEPALVGLTIFSPDSSGAKAPPLLPLWEGRELFHTATLRSDQVEVFRTEAPIHAPGGLRVARVDLDASAADFLVVHARHNVLISFLSGLALAALSLYAIWAARRTLRLELRQVQLEHLANLGQMSAVLAHEIRNPLGAVKGFVQLAAEQTPAASRELLDPAVSEIQRIERLVNDLLLYGRPPLPNPRPFSWSDFLKRIQERAARLFEGRPVHLITTAPAEVECATDPDLLEQILLNLLRNAVEATTGQAEAEVRLEIGPGREGEVVITVTDNGPGLPAEVRARLFQPFTTTKSSGAGLGLAISRSLAGSLGGDLSIENVTPQGARARLRIPCGPSASSRQNV